MSFEGEALIVYIGGKLAEQLREASRSLECTPEECVLAVLGAHFEPEQGTEDGLLTQLAETRDLLLTEQIHQGAYLAARLDNLELAVRTLLNLELQTDKRAYQATFQAIHLALSEEINRRAAQV